jgi:hypothetical protein
MDAKKGSQLELVAVPMPNEMVMEPPKAVLPSPPSIVTAPLLVLPSPEARVKLPPLLVDENPETIDESPPAAPAQLPAVTLNAPPMLVPESTEIAMLPFKPMQTSHSQYPRRHCCIPFQFQCSTIDHPTCLLLLH